MKAASTAPKTWFATKTQHLYRHKSGTYYARLLIDGKKTWRSLKTEVLSIAREELDKLQEDSAHQKEISQSGKVLQHLTGKEAIALRRKQLENDASIKRRTREYWNEILDSLCRSWPELESVEMRKVTAEQCEAWAGKNRTAMSPTRFNNTVSAIKTLFQIAIKKGARRINPAAEIKRAKIKTKDLSASLPSMANFAALVAEIRRPKARFSVACADLVEFFAYTGTRKSEAVRVEWQDCDFAKGLIRIKGDPEDATKNGEIRWIPMIPACRALLERLKAVHPNTQPTDSVCEVRECQKAMDRAFKALKLPRLTHHDLRHLFATVCIESGVDVPTVAKWMGHKDGGALAMKTYGHLRNDHSVAAAAKVSFAA